MFNHLSIIWAYFRKQMLSSCPINSLIIPRLRCFFSVDTFDPRNNAQLNESAVFLPWKGKYKAVKPLLKVFLLDVNVYINHNKKHFWEETLATGKIFIKGSKTCEGDAGLIIIYCFQEPTSKTVNKQTSVKIQGFFYFKGKSHVVVDKWNMTRTDLQLGIL